MLSATSAASAGRCSLRIGCSGRRVVAIYHDQQEAIMAKVFGALARGFGYLVFGAIALGVICAVLGGLAGLVAGHVIVGV
jgi:hypothetical protein